MKYERKAVTRLKVLTLNVERTLDFRRGHMLMLALLMAVGAVVANLLVMARMNGCDD
jgi:hypothetical protein